MRLRACLIRGGAPKHRVWYHNLKSDATAVMIQDGPEPFLAHVREWDGAEQARGGIVP